MTIDEAKKIVSENAHNLICEDSGFGDGSVVVSVESVFDTKIEAKEFIYAVKLLCQ